jgi:DNA-directed RNA polymerase subunit M/transcription elongation factor TFIIS
MEQYIRNYDPANYNFVYINKDLLTIDNFREFEKLPRLENVLKLSNLIKNYEKGEELEKGIFEYSISYCISHNYPYTFFESIYNDKLDELIYNLKPKSYLINLINKNEINIYNIPFLKNSEINPKNWEKITRKIEYSKLKESNLEYTDKYKCKKCGESKSKITMQQTRSSDEPMTIFITCLVCDKTINMDDLEN